MSHLVIVLIIVSIMMTNYTYYEGTFASLCGHYFKMIRGLSNMPSLGAVSCFGEVLLTKLIAQLFLSAVRCTISCCNSGYYE